MPETEIERSGVALAPEHELSPGNATAAEIGPDHRGEGPALEMLSLDPWIEDDRVAAGMESGSQLDVLDRRRRISPLVESADLLERFGADRAKPRPERRCRPGCLSVHVVVEEVPESRYEVGLGGIVVVGPEDGGDA